MANTYECGRWLGVLWRIHCWHHVGAAKRAECNVGADAGTKQLYRCCRCQAERVSEIPY
jgi:hypothetical protein